MFSSSKDNALLAMIRNGQEMSGSQKLNLIVQLSIPSILAQLTTIMMFYIDASMVGSLGAKASASIGIVESTTWLFGGLPASPILGSDELKAQNTPVITTKITTINPRIIYTTCLFSSTSLQKRL